MVVVVMRMTASPARGAGLGTSSTAIWSLPLNTTAFIVFMKCSLVALTSAPPLRESLPLDHSDRKTDAAAGRLIFLVFYGVSGARGRPPLEISPPPREFPWPSRSHTAGLP